MPHGWYSPLFLHACDLPELLPPLSHRSVLVAVSANAPPWRTGQQLIIAGWRPRAPHGVPLRSEIVWQVHLWLRWWGGLLFLIESMASQDVLGWCISVTCASVEPSVGYFRACSAGIPPPDDVGLQFAATKYAMPWKTGVGSGDTVAGSGPLPAPYLFTESWICLPCVCLHLCLMPHAPSMAPARAVRLGCKAQTLATVGHQMLQSASSRKVMLQSIRSVCPAAA